MGTSLPRSYSKRMNLRITGYITGLRQRLVASQDISRVDVVTDKFNKDAITNNVDVVATNADPKALKPVADNDDVWRRRFFKNGRTKLIRRLLAVGSLFSKIIAFLALLRSNKFTRREKIIMATRLRPLEDEELDEQRRAQESNALFKFHQEQAKILETRIIEQLAQLRFCQYETKNGRVFIKKRMQVTQVDVNPYSYTYHFKLPAPFGVNVFDIATPVTTNILAASIGKSLNVLLDKDGLRIIIEIGSRLSIPTFVTYKEMMDKMPKKLPLLSYPAGMSVNGSLTYRNIDVAPHLVIAGQSGGGKSNAQNVIICTLISRNDPMQLRCIFIDLKNGVEFIFYDGIPHLQPMSNGDGWENSGIIERSEDVPNALLWITRECERRANIIKKAGCKDVNEYNRRKHIRNRIPILMVFFDEYASVKFSEDGKEAEKLLTKLGNIGRSSGIHVVLSTQKPGADVISTNILVNFMQRIAFNISGPASQSLIGNYDAQGLFPLGRAILHTNEGNIPVQFPRITNSTIKTIVSGVKDGNVDISGMLSVDTDEILNWALNNAGGKLDLESLYNQFKEKISRDHLRDLVRSMDNQVFEVQGTFYRIVPPAGTKSRCMELDDEDGDGHSDVEAADSHPPTSEIAEIDEETPEIMHDPRAHVPEAETDEKPETTENLLNPRRCEECGAQAFEDPCEYCGTYEDAEKEAEHAS